MNKTLEMIREYCLPSGAYSNEKYFEKWVEFDENIKEEVRLSVFDPQTSGGLLISVSRDRAEELLNNINAKSEIKAVIVGEVKERALDNKFIQLI